MPAEQALRPRNEVVGYRMPPQIDHQHLFLSDASEACQQFHHLFVGEMMQEQRAEDVVETARPERQRERVSHYSIPGASFEMRLDVIQTSHLRPRPPLAQAARHVARRRANI